MRSLHPDRRDILRAAAASTALAALTGNPAARSAGSAERALVLVQLTGGNDGLSTVVPFADDAYAENRKATRIAPSEVARLTDQVGLHPNLKGLRARYDAGELAVVQGCGYPDPNRSHFKSMEIWHAGDPRGRASGTGWIGRLCEVAFGDDRKAGRLVHVGGTTPFSLYSRFHGATSFVVPEGYRWLASEEAVAEYDERVDAKGAQGKLAFLRGVMSDARESSRAVRAAAASYRPSVRYPDDPFGFDLMAAAAVLHGDLGARVISTSLRGFDTHSNQRGAHDTLMRRLDEGLDAFLADLRSSEVGRRAVVVVFSEFGRRVKENGSRGTDHGTAGPMFVAGPAVLGGLYGAQPSLTELDRGDLVHTTDFRSVYGAVAEGCFGVPASRVLGAEFPRLELLRPVG